MIKNSLLNRVAALSLVFPLVSLPVLPVYAADLPQSREQIQLSFAPLVKDASPAVVNIYAKKIVQQRQRGALFDDPLFQRFFGRQAPLGRQRQRVENSLGSGVIVRQGGIVITNHHVIGDAQEIRVVMADRREFPAELLLKDERTDLAVLRLVGAPDDLPVLEFGNSEGLEVGDLVIAIGNPFGVGQTVTSGIVSGLARTSVGITDFRSFIQTDAAINPGNSGGALIDLSGKVIGINTAIYSKTGGNMGIGFAVPASMANAVVESALSGKPLVRPWLGFSGRDVDYETAEALGMDRPGGVLVESIYEGSPATKAGIRPGDVILEVDSHEVEDAQTLRFKLATKGVGGRSELGILRAGDRETIGFDLIAPPEDPPRDTYQVGGQGPLAGTEIVNLSPAVADELGLSTDHKGVMVTRVAGRSLANRLQIQPGTKILSVNGYETATVDDVRAVVADPPGEWHLVVEQNGRKRVIEVR